MYHWVHHLAHPHCKCHQLWLPRVGVLVKLWVKRGLHEDAQAGLEPLANLNPPEAAAPVV